MRGEEQISSVIQHVGQSPDGSLTPSLLSCRFQEEDPECPLCMEEMDLSDINFKPCPCGYQVRPHLPWRPSPSLARSSSPPPLPSLHSLQICRFCHHHILANLNKRCPACRRQYTEDGIEFIPVGAEESVFVSWPSAHVLAFRLLRRE